MIRRPRTTMAAMLVMLVAGARPALACPVCFGASNEPMALATNMGILAMLAVVAGVLGAFASFFIYLMRRAKMAASESSPAAAEGPAGYAESGGIAQ